VDLVPLEGIKMEEVEPVTFNVSVKVLAEGENAAVEIPPEIIPTERLVSYLYQVLKARNLNITQWTLNESQQKALEALSNVVVEPQTEEAGD
jgi:hypothetical protein